MSNEEESAYTWKARVLRENEEARAALSASRSESETRVVEVDVAPKHVHKWQPNGMVNVEQMYLSPVSAMDHQIEVGTYSVTVCECGATRRVLVARKYRWANR